MFRNSIKFNLIVTCSLIILVPFIVLSVYLIITESQRINSTTFAALKQNCISISESADKEIEQMNMISTDIAYSYLIKDKYSQYLVDQSDHEKAKDLNDLITTAIGPNRPVDQVNIYSKIGTVIAAGLYYNIYDSPVEKMPWYSSAKNNNGNRVLTYTGDDPYISRYTTDAYGKLFFSLSREYYDMYNNVQGYIEVKESVKQVLSQAISYKSVYGEQVLVFDGNGNIVYPLNGNKYQSIFEHISKPGLTSDFIKVSDSKSNSFVTFSKSPDGIYTAIALSENALYMPTNSYILGVILLTIISLIFAAVISYFASNRITLPIERIYHEMQHISLDGYITRKSLNTRVIELNVLYDSFIDMQHELVDSLNKQLLLKNQEMQSKMLALQSQMNPHFLFNSLQTIQSMADAKMDSEIIIMCQSMSNILRYISSDAGTTVPLSDEIKYTKDFLCCMSIRYNNDLFYTIDIPEDMNNIKIPKLCIQQLVENSVKYCTTKLPPYYINISSTVSDNKYLITVTDNGPGFSSKSLSLISSKMNEIDTTGLLPSLEIKGMGLLNIYLRLKILYGDLVVFNIKNIENKGASITIGGPCEK